MKFSEAMLKGYQMAGGRQFHGGTYAPADDNWNKPSRVCVLGAATLALSGCAGGTGASTFTTLGPEVREFCAAWGIRPEDLNDEGMPWEHIYGMAVAAGL